MNNYNNINNIATIIPQFNMAFTRKQAKQQQQQEQRQRVRQNSHQIDFIDASMEWRKNKIKRENGTFEYI